MKQSIRSRPVLKVFRKLRPVLPKRRHSSAGNATRRLNDWSAMVIVTSLMWKPKPFLGLPIISCLVEAASSAGGTLTLWDRPHCCIGAKVLNKVELERSLDLDLIEANEAFAVASSVCEIKSSGLDSAKVNEGGAVALGPIRLVHLVVRILVSLLHEMQRQILKKGLANVMHWRWNGCCHVVSSLTLLLLLK